MRDVAGYRGNIWRLFAVQALLAFILWVPIWVVFLQRKGLSLTQVGLLEGVAWTITAFLEVPTGAVARHPSPPARHFTESRCSSS